MKTILAITATIFTALNLHAQGTVNFGSVSAGGITNGRTRMPVSGTTFRASLYYLPYVEGAPMPRSEDFVLALRPDTISILPTGEFAAGTRSTPATTMPRGIAWFQVKAWEVAFGTSYEEVVRNPININGRAALIGTSNIVKVRTGDGTTLAPGSLVATPEPGFGGLRGFFLPIIPEPSTIGLGLLGVAALVLVRPRKK